MLINNTLWLNLAVALGIGLLVGADRERSKGAGQDRSSAGIRTFTIASLLGAVSITINFWLLLASVFCVVVFTATAYYTKRSQDPGLTTEIALVFTVILGGLAMSASALAAALAVALAILLAAKESMHGFVLGVVTKDELNDFLILAAATLIILPLVPNTFIGPFEAINPRNLWLVIILVMAISAFAHLALRWFGGRIGLPIAGLVSGFISSIATIGAMGAHAKEAPATMSVAVAGAVLSSLATVIQLAMLLAAIHPPTLRAVMWPLFFAGGLTGIYGLLLAINSFQKTSAETAKTSKTFSVKTALMLATLIAVALITSAALKAWFGQAGLVAASGVTGLADVHAATISVATLAAAGKLGVENAVIPLLVAFSVNTISKAVAAFIGGGKEFTLQVMPCLILQAAAMWLVWWLT